MTAATPKACSRPRRRRLSSISPSTCSARPAPKDVLSTTGSSTPFGFHQPPSLRSRTPGVRNGGRTHRDPSLCVGDEQEGRLELLEPLRFSCSYDARSSSSSVKVVIVTNGAD